jgi:cell division protein FtsZ
LVNITAGESLTLGEFSEVGDTVEEFASENATVVVGTVIDEELQDDLRVTVVATGLGQVEDLSTRLVATSKEQRPADTGMDYKGMERPAVFRQQGARADFGAERQPAPVAGEIVEEKSPELESVADGASEASDYLDIPAFLRRRSD